MYVVVSSSGHSRHVYKYREIRNTMASDRLNKVFDTRPIIYNSLERRSWLGASSWVCIWLAVLTNNFGFFRRLSADLNISQNNSFMPDCRSESITMHIKLQLDARTHTNAVRTEIHPLASRLLGSYSYCPNW